MAIKVTDLIPILRSEIGDENSENYKYTTEQLRDTKIPAGLSGYNQEMFQQYEILGSGATAYFNPAPGIDTQNLLILFTALHIVKGERFDSARNALTYSNPAGRTDLSEVVKALASKEATLRSDIDKIKNRIGNKLLNGEIKMDDLSHQEDLLAEGESADT